MAVVFLDGMETSDAFERLVGDRCRAGGCEFVKAADMRPAQGGLYFTAFGRARGLGPCSDLLAGASRING